MTPTLELQRIRIAELEAEAAELRRQRDHAAQQVRRLLPYRHAAICRLFGVERCEPPLEETP